jgi:hypothetical protein
MLEHHRDAVLNRIVAAAPTAVQPGVRGNVWTGCDRVMTYRANEYF